MAQTTETIPPERLNRATESIQDVVDHIFEQPFDAQLGILRTIAPKILKYLREDERFGYLRDLNDEIRRADSGEPTYDIRPAAPNDT